MRATTCLLALVPVLGVFSAQLALIPANGVLAAPLAYREMKLSVRDDFEAVAKRGDDEPAVPEKLGKAWTKGQPGTEKKRPTHFVRKKTKPKRRSIARRGGEEEPAAAPEKLGKAWTKGQPGTEKKRPTHFVRKKTKPKRRSIARRGGEEEPAVAPEKLGKAWTKGQPGTEKKKPTHFVRKKTKNNKREAEEEEDDDDNNPTERPGFPAWNKTPTPMFHSPNTDMVPAKYRPKPKKTIKRANTS